MEASGPSVPAVPREPTRFEKRLVGALVKTFFFRGRRGPKRALPPHLNATKIHFRGNSGAKLIGDHVQAPHPRGIVVLAHPDRRYGRHWFAKEGWLEWLVEHHFDAVTFDFAVYGESKGGSTYLHEDVMAACHQARLLQPNLPVHVIGLSIGAFATLNALPKLPFIDRVVLESPYPTFDAWYDATPSGMGRINAVMRRLFPRTYTRIHAGQNAKRIDATRVLVAGTRADAVTPIALTRAVVQALPGCRVHELESPEHLHLFEDATYRQAILEHLDQATPAPHQIHVAASTTRAMLK